MSSPVEQAALVALLRAGRRPPQVYADLVEVTGSARRVLEDELARADPPETLFHLSIDVNADPARADLCAMLEEATSDIAAWRGEGICVVSVLDPNYPENLRRLPDRPPLLFLAGELVPADARALAVVGSRAPSADGIAAACRIAGDLVDGGYTVLSGLAAGIDTATHTAALDQGGRTVAVVGTGLRHCYPTHNLELAQRIGRECALVSQFWPDSPPTRRSFPMRNAVMSGMSLGTVIVDASATSGTRIQARLALAQERPVFVHRSLLSQPWAHDLASRPGAYPIVDAGEVIAVVERLAADEELMAHERTRQMSGL
jgi:DNA processing protein